MAVFVISDTHGRYDELCLAFTHANIEDEDFVVHLGDLTNGVENSKDGDLACLEMVGREIDVLLVGNHEIPYFHCANHFSGFHYYEEIDLKLHELFHDEGRISAAFLHEGTLITHAGISRGQLTPDMHTVSHVWDKIEQEWHTQNFSHRLFSDVGHTRGGDKQEGGILWCDFQWEFEPVELFPQIVGHTTGNNIRIKGNAICIDAQGDVRNPDHRLPTIIKLEERK
jgi:hypothetical protein